MSKELVHFAGIWLYYATNLYDRNTNFHRSSSHITFLVVVQFTKRKWKWGFIGSLRYIGYYVSFCSFLAHLSQFQFWTIYITWNMFFATCQLNRLLQFLFSNFPLPEGWGIINSFKWIGFHQSMASRLLR